MAYNVHSLISATQDIADKGLHDVRAPVQVPSRAADKAAQPTRKVRSKYRHVAAPHSKAQPSCLSHETTASPSFIGFRNLMVLTIIVMNLRLVVENARKYGLLITLKSNLSSRDVKTALVLYACTPCHLFIAYVIERVAMEHAKGVIGRRKKTDPDADKKPETEKQTKEFLNTWWLIAIAHTLNATLALTISSWWVYYRIHNPGLGTISELHAIVVWLKTCSYAFTNRDLRHAMLNPGGPESALPEFYSSCPYPKNITLPNLCYFWWAPTLIYQPCYPRTDRIRWTFVVKRVGEVVALSVFIWLVCAQYAVPLLRNSLGGMASFNISSIAERVMKLSPIAMIVWLAGFFALFHSFLNALAEIMMFGDRVFYEDWWNSINLKEYWSTWNKPVYHFMRRHIYSPLVGRGWSHQAASTWVFVFSGFLHELAIGVPSHNILGVAFLGMVLQLPLIAVTEVLSKSGKFGGKVAGNCIFWLSFVIVGQPLAAMTYFFWWQMKYGELSKVAQCAQ
ncbi:Diacylglycerol O-acyltransferase 1 [Cladophialophora carrionii]|uniref:O-acyltransferase n=1 Tax=Cladophialophora carrionii TaxID=86049 RepID=A0A1C1CYA3_9EURO|nr:Diacylglycerol O-acyltransferase 1 [Cladophialophora carrionii]